MILPTLNSNGSSAHDLIQPRREAYDLLQAAIKALQRVAPNGRDYAHNDQCVADRDAHYTRLKAIHTIAAELVAEAVAIKEQI
jgi:thiamine phosphate synthase YjbQ (UPF0047 family)